MDAATILFLFACLPFAAYALIPLFITVAAHVQSLLLGSGLLLVALGLALWVYDINPA